MSIRALLSGADGSDAEIDLGDITSRRVKRDELLWVDALDPTEDEAGLVRQALKLTERSAEAFAPVPSEPTARVLEDGVEVVVLTLGDELGTEPIPLQILIGDGWVITHHDDAIAYLDEHRESIQDQREVGCLTPVEFLASVLDWHVDTFFEAAEQLERKVDELDDAALRTERDLLDRLVAMRRRIARVRRVIATTTRLPPSCPGLTSCRRAGATGWTRWWRSQIGWPVRPTRWRTPARC